MESDKNGIRESLDKNVPKAWKPVEGLAERPSKMMFSDRVYYWLVSLGGLAVVAAGVGIIWLGISGKLGGALIGLGLGIFVAGGPTQAARNGYRF
jgi:hypothetical protein